MRLEVLLVLDERRPQARNILLMRLDNLAACPNGLERLHFTPEEVAEVGVQMPGSEDRRGRSDSDEANELAQALGFSRLESCSGGGDAPPDRPV